MFDTILQHRESRVDRLQIAALIGLMVLGTLFVYSATMVRESALTAAWYEQTWVRQIVWYGLGIGAEIDARDHHVGQPVEQARHREVDAVGRRAVDEQEAVGRAANGQRPVERQRIRRAAAVALRRDHGLSETQARARMEKMLHVVLA